MIPAPPACPTPPLHYHPTLPSLQAFCLRHLTEEAQWRHWQRLIDKYASLYRGPLPANGGKKGLPPPGARRRAQEAAAGAAATDAGRQPAAAGGAG